MPDISYYNGNFTALDAARVAMDDRAFYFGDGIYEVVKVLGHRFFALGKHLERLWRSAAGIELTLPWSRPQLEGLLGELLERSGHADALLYLQVSRGIGPRKHSFPRAGGPPSVAAWVKQFKGTPPEYHERGVGVITRPDDRWAKCWIKSLNLLPNCMAMEAAARAGAYEALLVDRDGLVNECSAANVFCVSGGVIRTAPTSRNILAGVSRGVAIACAGAARLPLEEHAFSVPEMLAAEEVFLTSTSPDILPVVSVDGRPIGDGRPGALTRKLLDLFRCSRDDLSSSPVGHPQGCTKEEGATLGKE